MGRLPVTEKPKLDRASACDGETRYDLPPIALQRAKEHTGIDFVGEDVVMIGDSIHDVRCGKMIGARTIAVASGPTPREWLIPEEPSVFLDDLADTEEAISAILGA